MLERHGYANEVDPWNRMAAALAREAAGSGGWVLGDVGPFGDFLEPLGDMTDSGLHEIFCEQMQALVDGGADALLVETMSDAAEAVIGIRAAKSVAGLPVVATFAFQKADTQFRTMMGTSVGEVIQTVIAAGADIVGANCGTDLSLEDYLVLARELKTAAGSVPVILQPNAGSPKQGPEGIHYDATAAEMAETAVRLRDAGVAIIGGCCGTSPTHLAAMSAALK